MAEAPGDACGRDTSACVALDADLGWALGVVFRRYVKQADAVVADLPGGPRGYQVLAAAAGELAGTQQALGQRLGVDRTVMTYLLDDLERAGLIERRPDPADRRARRIVVTEQGYARLAGCAERMTGAEDQVLGALDEADRATFRSLLQRAAKQASALDPAAACEVATDARLAAGAVPRRPGSPTVKAG
jgi:DNA-binding MarR family transcriptional regulator